jgi:hypothetical protein
MMRKYINKKTVMTLLAIAVIGMFESGCGNGNGDTVAIDYIDHNEILSKCDSKKKNTADYSYDDCVLHCDSFTGKEASSSNYDLLDACIESPSTETKSKSLRSLDTRATTVDSAQMLKSISDNKVNFAINGSTGTYQAEGSSDSSYFLDGAVIEATATVTEVVNKSLRAVDTTKTQQASYKMKKSDFKYSSSLKCPKTDTEYITYHTYNTYNGSVLTSKTFKVTDDNDAECTFTDTTADTCTIHHASEGAISIDVTDTVKGVVGSYAKVKIDYPMDNVLQKATLTIESGDVFVCK